MNRMIRIVCVGLPLTLLVVGCGGGGGGSGEQESASDYAAFRELSPAVCAPDAGPFSLVIDNPYFPLAVGDQLTYAGEDEGVLLELQIEVLDEIEDVAGVATRVVQETEREDGELVEISRNFFVQAPDGTVCYYGEEVDIYENGVVVSNDGAWRAGDNGNLPGIFMPGTPEEETQFAQEFAPGVAEDRSAVTELGRPVTVPAGTFADTVRIGDWNPLADDALDIKFYAAGVGLVVDEDLELVSF